jgi:hypothetical protein
MIPHIESALIDNFKPNADETAQKKRKTYFIKKCVLELNFTTINGLGGSILSTTKKSKSLYPNVHAAVLLFLLIKNQLKFAIFQISMERSLAEESANPVEMCEIVLKEEVGEDVLTDSDGWQGISKESESCQVFIKEEVKEEHVEESVEPVESFGGEDPLIR